MSNEETAVLNWTRRKQCKEAAKSVVPDLNLTVSQHGQTEIIVVPQRERQQCQIEK